MTNSTLQRVTVEGKDIHNLIVDKLRPALEGEKLAHSVLAMLTFSILLMKPDIDLEDLQELVMDTSEFMIMHITPIQDGEAN